MQKYTNTGNPMRMGNPVYACYPCLKEQTGLPQPIHPSARRTALPQPPPGQRKHSRQRNSPAHLLAITTTMQSIGALR